MAGSNNKTNRNAYFAKKAKSEAKKLPNIAKIFIVFFFILGVAASFLVCHFLCKNDCFEINGKKSYSISVGETYIDDGVKVIGFGQDLTEKVTVKVYDANKNLLSENSYDLKLMNFWADFGASDEIRLTPIEDDKPKDAENSKF